MLLNEYFTQLRENGYIIRSEYNHNEMYLKTVISKGGIKKECIIDYPLLAKDAVFLHKLMETVEELDNELKANN